MCNSELTDSLRERVRDMMKHTSELRLKFNDLQEEFREGNLDEATVHELNRAVHQIEGDAAGFEQLAESA